MKIAIKKIDIHKIDQELIKSQFGSYQIGEIEYNSSELTKALNEFVFEFDYSKENDFIKYLKRNLITGRILK